MFFWRSTIPGVDGGPGIEVAFTGRAAGTGESPYSDSTSAATSATSQAVDGNRDALAASLGVTRDRLLFMNQVHGTDVVEVEGPWAGSVPRADGIVSATSRLALAVLVADCVPVLLRRARPRRRRGARSARLARRDRVPRRRSDACPWRGAGLGDRRSVRVRPVLRGARESGSGGGSRRPHVRDDVLGRHPGDRRGGRSHRAGDRARGAGRAGLRVHERGRGALLVSSRRGHRSLRGRDHAARGARRERGDPATLRTHAGPS